MVVRNSSETIMFLWDRLDKRRSSFKVSCVAHHSHRISAAFTRRCRCSLDIFVFISLDICLGALHKSFIRPIYFLFLLVCLCEIYTKQYWTEELLCLCIQRAKLHCISLAQIHSLSISIILQSR